MKDQCNTIAAVFEHQVSQYPDEIAIISEKITLTYHQLNQKANQLAYLIQSQANFETNNLIAVCLERNEAIIISILAILKAGAAYVPIDPQFPEQRIKFILSDVNPTILLCNSRDLITLNAIKPSGTITLALDDVDVQNKMYACPTINNSNTSKNNRELAYVIYTSGTTGQPKGVMIEQLSYLDLIKNIWDLHFKRQEQIHTYSITNYIFDIFGLEYGLPLLSGGTFTLGNIEQYPLNCSDYDFVQMTPSLLSLKLDAITFAGTCKLFVGGEPLNPHLLQKALEKFHSVSNLYGPTETTIWSTAKIYTQMQSPITIGQALKNEQLLVLDENLAQIPAGEIGELYIGGLGLARGYLNRADLTKEKFIQSPFNANQKLYRTGDMVRLLANGEIEYIGRNDFQVKINGYRIELGEIETIISQITGVKQTVVVAREEKNAHYLIAYYTANLPIDDVTLYDYLKNRLPSYMIPSRLIYLAQFPLTFNGKLDRSALPDPKNQLTSNAKKKSSTTIEKIVTNLWEQILELEPGTINLEDDFFKLGGNSILGTRLITAINHEFSTKLNVIDIYTSKTVQAFVQKVAKKRLSYQPIISFNESHHDIHKSNIFMIHPGAGGCEVYHSLALKLKALFNCYGLDSYNLYNQVKINSLNKLAHYYLEQIDLYSLKSKQSDWHLLGWSLGGQIALEMAVILEKQGVENITVYLLDTVLNDQHLLKLRSELDIIPLKAKHEKNALLHGYDKEYVQLVINNMDVEHQLICQDITDKLNVTKIHLFKAALMEQKNINAITQYIAGLKVNNMEYFFNNKDDFNLYTINDADHNNILLQEEYLYEKIKAIIE